MAQDTPIAMVYEKGEVFPAYIESFNKKTNIYKAFVIMGGANCDGKYTFADVPRKDVLVMFLPDSMCKILG